MSTETAAPIWTDLRPIIERAINSHPRTLQTALGPSEVGNACDRCLVHLLAGQRGREIATPWLPTVGTAVHAWLEAVFSPDPRFITEGRVCVGELGGEPLCGSSDLFDTHTGTVVDWKITGKSTRVAAQRHGPSLTYQRQAHLYGAGWAALGHDVKTVAIAFLPRDHVSLSASYVWQAPFSPQIAQDTLDRANRFLAWLDAFGLDAVLSATPEHTGDEFSCRKVYHTNTAPGGHPVTVASIITG